MYRKLFIYKYTTSGNKVIIIVHITATATATITTTTATATATATTENLKNGTSTD